MRSCKAEISELKELYGKITKDLKKYLKPIKNNTILIDAEIKEACIKDANKFLNTLGLIEDQLNAIYQYFTGVDLKFVNLALQLQRENQRFLILFREKKKLF